MSNLAPIILFTYRRLAHTRKVVEALRRNDLASESELFIYSDGPKDGEEDIVHNLRMYLKSIKGFKCVHLVERKTNMGLADSVITGVSDVIKKYGKIIVLEDDIVCAPNFLSYMNYALDKYFLQKKVFSVSGCSYLVDSEKKDVPDTYFLKIISSWSWATWRDRWEYFDQEATGYKRLKWNFNLRDKFNYDGSINYYKILMKQMKKDSFFYGNRKLWFSDKKIDSWAIKWYWSVFRQEGLTLYPRDSFIVNIGFDGSGTNCGADNVKKHEKFFNSTESLKYEEVIEEKEDIREKIKASLKG